LFDGASVAKVAPPAQKKSAIEQPAVPTPLRHPHRPIPADERHRMAAGDDMTRKTLLMATALAALSATIAVPAVSAAPTVRARVVDGTLRVTGSPFADTIVLGISGTDANQLQIDVNGDRSADDTFDINTFASIVVDAGRGNDFVQLDTANGAFTTARPTIVVGGKGDDTLLGGSGNELFFGGPGNDFVDGNGGADTYRFGDMTRHAEFLYRCLEDSIETDLDRGAGLALDSACGVPGPAAQRRMYTMTPCRSVHSLPTGHAPFLSAPDRLASILRSAAG
jgi:hypothetical protein